MNKDSLIELAAWHQSVPVQTFVETVFSSKPKFMQDSMIQYLIESGIAHFSEEGHVNQYGEYVVEPAAIEKDVMPKLVFKFPAILLSEIRPTLTPLLNPMLEVNQEAQEEKDRRERIEILEKLIEANPDELEIYNSNLVSRFTKKQVWEKLDQMAGRNLFWAFKTFSLYTTKENGKVAGLIKVKAIVWMQDKSKR